MCLPASLDTRAWRKKIGVGFSTWRQLRHLFRNAPYKAYRLVCRQRVFQQQFKVVPVFHGPFIVAHDHAGELAPARVDIQDIRQPAVEFQ